MAEAVIVSTARTPIGKAYRGAFNNTHGATLTGHVIEHAVQRARLDPAEVEDVIIGCAMPEGATGHNIARQAALRAGLPVTAAATTVNRFCSSGLQAIAIAAQRVIVDRVPVAVAGGVESISLVQNEHQNRFRLTEDWLLEHKPEVYMSMLETAEIVAKRYGVTREAQDRYALESQRRIAAAQREGTARRRDRAAQVRQDRHRQGHRADARGIGDPHPGRGQSRRHDGRGPRRPQARRQRGGHHHRRQREPALRRRLGLRRRWTPGWPSAAAWRRWASSGARRRRVRAGRDGHRPGLRRAAAPRALTGSRWTTSTSGSSTRPSRSRCVYCRDRLGIPMEKLNVDGGSIAIGHPYGMSGARMTGHALIEGSAAAQRAWS